MAKHEVEEGHLVIDIDLANADFGDDFLDVSAVKSIFDQILLELESVEMISMKLVDRNGNTVGRAEGGFFAEYEEEEEEEEEE